MGGFGKNKLGGALQFYTIRTCHIHVKQRSVQLGTLGTYPRSLTYSINEYEVFVFLVQSITNGFLAKMSPCLVSSRVLCEITWRETKTEGRVDWPEDMLSTPSSFHCCLSQDFITCTCLSPLLSSVLLELCSSGLPPNLVKRVLILYTDSLFRFSYYVYPCGSKRYLWSSYSVS